MDRAGSGRPAITFWERVFSSSSSATASIDVAVFFFAPTASRNQLPSLPSEPFEVFLDIVA
jgi:hypothetical protein